MPIVEVILNNTINFYTLDEFELSIKNGEIFPRTKVKSKLLSNNKWVYASELELFKGIYSPDKLNYRQYFKISRFPWLTTALIFILVFFSVVLLGEYLITLKNTASLESKKDELFAKYNLKPTMMQNRSVLKEYTVLHTRQTKIRQTMAYLLSLRLQNKQKLSSLSVKGKKLIAVFSGVKQETQENILQVFRSKNVKFLASFKDTAWYVEIEL